MPNGITQSRSDSTSLSRNIETDVVRGLSRVIEEPSGLNNDAFCVSDTFPLSLDNQTAKRSLSGIVRTFSREINNRDADEATALLDSSPFGTSKPLEEDASSSSSLVSSDMGTVDENEYESDEEFDEDEGLVAESQF